MQRYDYEDPSAVSEKGQIRVIDRARGSGKPIAWCGDVDAAERIVRLLNADETRKEPA